MPSLAAPPTRPQTADLPAALDPQAAAELRTAAAKVLRANDRGTMTVAAPELYPHQWSWDAGFVVVGLSHLSVPRACVELESLLAGQWRTGMIPHIVFSSEAAPYFPGPDWWRTHELADAAPRSPLTSGICQPPVHAIGLWHILRHARANGGDDVEIADEFARRAWPALYAWHRWLVNARRDETSGLVAIVHSWESGLDNSPRWDAPYQAVPLGPLPPYHRQDVGVVDDRTQRPSDREYDRYLWLVEELKHAGYDDAAIGEKGSFRVGDVLFTAILSVACDVLAALGGPAARGCRRDRRPGDRPGPRLRRSRWSVARQRHPRRFRPTPVRRAAGRFRAVDVRRPRRPGLVRSSVAGGARAAVHVAALRHPGPQPLLARSTVAGHRLAVRLGPRTPPPVLSRTLSASRGAHRGLF